MTAYANPPRFDSLAFAGQVQAALTRYPNMRAAVPDAGVDLTTLSRAARGWPSLSHENWLRLTAWLNGSQEQAA